MELVVNKKLGQIHFDMSPIDVRKVMGLPNEVDTKHINLLIHRYDCIKSYLYWEVKEEIYESVSIFPHTIKLVDFIKDGDLFEPKTRSTIQRFHSKNKISFEEEVSIGDLDDNYFYPNIGITIWVEDGRINDICVEKVYPI